jgi:DNA replication protein DnaC
MAEMKLEGMLKNLEETLNMAAQNQWSHTDMLDALVQAEYDFREKKRTGILLKNSKLKSMPALEDIDLTAKRDITKVQVKELYTLGWLGHSRPLLIIGPTGVGKTFLAQALGHHACRRKYSTLFMTFANLLEHQAMARTAGTYIKLRDKLIKPQLLILDDFGLRKLNSVQAHDLCEILEERSNDKSTIITTQLTLDHWTEVIEDPVIADAIIDRLIHSSIKIIMKGESYRKIKAKKLDDQNKVS